MPEKRFKLILIPLSAICVALSVVMFVQSLSGAAIAGCGAGSGCDNVMGSRWGYFLGTVPVSLPAVAVYLILLLCALFVGGKSRDSESLDRMLWPLMLVIGGSIIGCAVWFCWLQAGVIHAFCKYCTLLHLLGCIASCMVIAGSPCRRLRFVLAGLLCACLFVILQVRTAPEYVYDEGRADSSLPVFSSNEMFSTGPAETSDEVTLLFDFQCVHCRRLHPLLKEAAGMAGVRVVLCPVPLSRECNPYIPDGVDRFSGSCGLTRLSLAIWFSHPELYPGYESWLMGGEVCPSVAEAREMASELIGEEGLAYALEDGRIDAYLKKAYELFGRTSNSEKSGIPRFISGRKWIVPEVDTVDGLSGVLIALTEKEL
ncbi:MAG: hypothetical protein MJY89_04515 [Bacteroidales bacterium]|nr:hypothetical protein [Bacteroidales bacterium]